MSTRVDPPSIAESQEAQRLLKQAIAASVNSKSLISRVRAKLQHPKSDAIVVSLVNYTDVDVAPSAGVLQALVELLKQHASVERWQAVLHELLVITAKRGHTEALQYFLQCGASVDRYQGKALQTAVLSNYPKCVELLLEKSPSVDSVQRALLITDFLESDQYRMIAKLLLSSGIHFDVLDYLIAKAHSALSSDSDPEILELLVQTKERASVQPRANYADSNSLKTYFAAQQQIRRASSIANPAPSILVQHGTSFSWHPKRDIFGDKVLHDTDNLAVKLLKRYIDASAISRGSAEPWSLVPLDLLLDRMTVGAEALPEYTESLKMAVSFQQTNVFARLLQHKPISQVALLALPLDLIVREPGLLIALFDHLLQHFPNDEEYLKIVEPLFIRACGLRPLSQAVEVSRRSRVQLAFSVVRDALASAIAERQGINEISELIATTKVTMYDLDNLWNLIIVPPKTLCDSFSTEAARMLLEAGCESDGVVALILDFARSGSNVPGLCMVLDEWRVSKTLSLRDEYDYKKRCVKVSEEYVANIPYLQYFVTLGSALRLAIQHEHLDICEALLERGAPVVSGSYPVISGAVSRGNTHLSMEKDKILSMLLDCEKERSNAQDVLDYALLQAVVYGRAQLVADLIEQGASAAAYQNYCWFQGVMYESQQVLDALLSASRCHAELSTIFEATFVKFIGDSHPANHWQLVQRRLRKAGFIDAKCSMMILIRLCQRDDISVQLAEELTVDGVTGEPDIRECLQHCLTYQNLPVFKILARHRVVTQATIEYLLGRTGWGPPKSAHVLCPHSGKLAQKKKAAAWFETVSALLDPGQPLAPKVLTDLLENVALASRIPNQTRIPLLKSLLRRGACFSKDASTVLLHCLFVKDVELLQLVDASHPPSEALEEVLQLMFQLPEEVSDPGPYVLNRVLGHLLRPVTSPRINLTNSIAIDITRTFLKPDVIIPSSMIHHFYSSFKVLLWVEINLNLSHQSVLEAEIESCMDIFANTQSRNRGFVERLAAVLSWVRPRPMEEHPGAPVSSVQSFWLSRVSLNRCLIRACKSGWRAIVKELLKAGISPNAIDKNYSSALRWAVIKDQPAVVRSLIDAKAYLEDGILHEAFCRQHQVVMEILIASGLDLTGMSLQHDGLKPLLAFIKFDHPESTIKKFSSTIEIFMTKYPVTREASSDLKSAIDHALLRPYAFALLSALLPWLESYLKQGIIGPQLPVFRGPFRYSLVTYIEREKKYSRLTDGERTKLTSMLKDMGFEGMFYTTKGDQPKDAVNVPRALYLAEEARNRRQAFSDKECCIHTEKVDDPSNIHAGLLSTCAASHGWKDDIICTDCLKQYLEGRMFPHDDLTIRYKFPSTKIPCWAPRCQSTLLPHSILQKYADPEIFRLYDIALCQSLLREGQSMVKCAFPDCPGAHWYDERDVEGNLKVFFCEICHQNTCVECNDLYEKHNNQPCPAGEEARKNERVKEEEKLSEEALKNEKRCPKCKLLYEKYFGCDHIICGKNVYDNRVDKGCRFSFCDICFGAWPDGHAAHCVHRL